MNKLAIFIAIFFFPLTIFSQERTSKPRAVIGSSIISQLNSATGWMLNPDDEWISANNTIPKFLGSEFKSLITYEKYGLGVDNFNYYQFRELSYNGSSYVVLIKEYRDGYYEYSSIEEGWHDLTSYYAYVFEKSELNKFSQIVDGKVNLIKIDLVAVVNIKFISKQKALSLISTKLGSNMLSEEKNTLIFHVAPYKEKGIVQFQIYTSYTEFYFIGGIITEFEAKGGEYDWSTKKVYLTDDLFKYCYYETDYNSFSQFVLSN